MTDYLLFKEDIDVKELMNSISYKIVYHSELSEDEMDINLSIRKGKADND